MSEKPNSFLVAFERYSKTQAPIVPNSVSLSADAALISKLETKIIETALRVGVKSDQHLLWEAQKLIEECRQQAIAPNDRCRPRPGSR